MTWLDIVLWSAVPFNYLFWIVVYPRLKKMNEYQKTFDLCLRIFIYGVVALWLLGFLRFLPDDLSDRIVNLLLGRIGLGK